MLHVRHATFEDLPILGQLEERCFTHYQMDKKSMRRLLKNGTASILVAQFQEQICGHLVVLYRKNSLNARLYSIAVDSQYRQKNVGTILFNEAEKIVRERGLKGIILEVSTDNNAAKNFYVKHGFNDQKMFFNYYDNGLHASRMFKNWQ